MQLQDNKGASFFYAGMFGPGGSTGIKTDAILNCLE
jgi:hypothetical protein